MNKLFLLSIVLCSFLPSFGQEYFVLTKSGLKPVSNLDAKFIVIEKQGTQAELFNSVKSFVFSHFVSPQDVSSEMDSTMITLNGISKDDIWAKKALATLQIKMNYTIVFHFKEGKIRIDNPSINKMTGSYSTSVYQLTLTKSDPYDLSNRFFIFDKDKIKAEPAKENIEAFFNNFVYKATHYQAPKDENW